MSACADGEVRLLEFQLLTLMTVDLCRVLSDDPTRKIEAVRVEELFHWWRCFRPRRITSVWDTQASTCDRMFPLRSFIWISLVPFSAWLQSNGLPDKSTYTEQSQDTPSSSPPSPLSSCVFLTSFFWKNITPFPLFPHNKDKPVKEAQLKLDLWGFFGSYESRRWRLNSVTCFSSEQEHLLFCILSFCREKGRERSL